MENSCSPASIFKDLLCGALGETETAELEEKESFEAFQHIITKHTTETNTVKYSALQCLCLYYIQASC